MTRTYLASWWLLCLAACDPSQSALRPQDVQAQVSDRMATVVHVRWTTEEPTVGTVEYGLTASRGQRTPTEATPTRMHERTLLGLKQDTDYHYRVVTHAEGATVAGDSAIIRTEHLPSVAPQLDVQGDGHTGFTLLPVLGATTAVSILDADGDVVWFHEDDRGLDVYRARLSVDGRSLLYNAASVVGDPEEDTELVRIALDGSSSSAIAVPLLAHDFVEHPDGTLAAIVVEYRDFEGAPLRGDSIVEIDADGVLRTVWSAWDCFDPSEVTGDAIEHGWTFANALDFDPDEDVYYLGMRNFSSIAKIDRGSGRCEWVLGSHGATLAFASGSGRFLHQHQFEVHGDHVIVMDNDGLPGADSRVIEYALDLERGIATEVWSYVSDPPVYTFVLGEPTRLPGGDTFISWSAAGQLERVNADGESIWKANSKLGYAFGFHTLADALYPSRDP